MAATGRLTFATTEGVVDGVHGHAARLGAYALPAVATGLTDLDQFVLGVADDAERGATVDRHATHLGRGQTQRGEASVFGDELHAHTGAAGHLAAPAGAKLHVVHGGTGGNEAHGQGVAGADVGLRAGLDVVADLQAIWREDVALLAVGVVQQRDAARAVGVVLNGGDLRGNVILVATKVDDAVLLLVATAAVTRGLAAVVVAATGAGLGLEQ